MKNATLPCSDERLRLLLYGDDRASQFDAAQQHLESCVACQSRFDELAADQEEWAEAKRLLAVDEADRRLAEEDEARSWSVAVHRRPSNAWSGSMASQLLSPPSHPEMLGRIGRYEVERLIAAGGMGVVFKAFDSELNRPVGVKVLAPHLAGSGAARCRFAREARAAAAVVNEHVVAIHNVQSEGESPFLVMQYVAGESLQARIDRCGPLDECEILRIVLQTAKGLAAAHAQGLIHRDVKPSNILLEQGIERALLTDFGLARAGDDASLTHTGYHPGTPQYMSPEQACGEAVDHRSDLFSLGSVMYTMCTGRPPFRAETSYGVLRRITDEEPRPIREINPKIPEWLCAIIAKLMSKEPDDRFEYAHEVAGLLEECLAHVQQPTTAPLPQSVEQLSHLHSPANGSGRKQLGQMFHNTETGRMRVGAMWLLAAVAFAAVVFFAGIVIRIKHDNKPDTIVEVDEGSKVQIGADGAVEVRLPDSDVAAAQTSYEANKAGLGDVLAVEVELLKPEAQLAREHVHTCATHPQVRQPDGGKCPICGMALQRAENVPGNVNSPAVDDAKSLGKDQPSIPGKGVGVPTLRDVVRKIPSGKANGWSSERPTSHGKEDEIARKEHVLRLENEELRPVYRDAVKRVWSATEERRRLLSSCSVNAVGSIRDNEKETQESWDGKLLIYGDRIRSERTWPGETGKTVVVIRKEQFDTFWSSTDGKVTPIARKTFPSDATMYRKRRENATRDPFVPDPRDLAIPWFYNDPTITATLAMIGSVNCLRFEEVRSTPWQRHRVVNFVDPQRDAILLRREVHRIDKRQWTVCEFDWKLDEELACHVLTKYTMTRYDEGPAVVWREEIEYYDYTDEGVFGFAFRCLGGSECRDRPTRMSLNSLTPTK